MRVKSYIVHAAAALCAIGATMSQATPLLSWDMDTRSATRPPDSNDIVTDLGSSGLDGLVMHSIGITRVESGGPFAASPAYYTHPGPGVDSQGIQVLGAQTALDVPDSYSISAWFQGHDATDGTTIAGRYDNGTSEGYVLRYESSDQVSFFHKSGGTFNLIFGVGPVIEDTDWHHLVGVFEEGVGSTLWLDGSIVDTANTTTSGFTASLTQNFMVGAQHHPPNERVFASGIDEVKLYDFALNEDQIANLFTLNTIVPEPSTVLLLGLGAVGLLRTGRRK